MKTASIGFPRIGGKRELKKCLESFWRGDIDEATLLETTQQLREQRWRQQQERGIDIIPSNDFALYDHVLDTICILGAVPPRFNVDAQEAVTLDCYFTMARGADGIPALEMTKWYDTNYHYLVPELQSGQVFHAHSQRIIDEFKAAQRIGIETRPVIVGPVSFLLLAKSSDDSDVFVNLDAILACYKEILQDCAQAGITWVQIDEPCLVGDLTAQQLAALQQAYAYFSDLEINIMLCSYFDALCKQYINEITKLPVQGLHLDLLRAPEQLETLASSIPDDLELSLGIIDGRNIWRADLYKQYQHIVAASQWHDPQRIQIAASCSLLHAPIDVDLETALDPDIKQCFAFALQKCAELHVLREAFTKGALSQSVAFNESEQVQNYRRNAAYCVNPKVRSRCAAITSNDAQRGQAFTARDPLQRAALQLPDFPSTTIGSFPQTKELRRQRRLFKKQQISQADYDAFIQVEVKKCITLQEEVGLDVLVHGEFERNDMVEYFGELLEGFVFTDFAWVQSYGSRCVKPPIIIGDVYRPHAMTVAWTQYAQSLTDKPVKGMLTGPVTILNWSFVRDDLSRAEVCQQVALAIRDEILDLEAAGVQIIQVDEPALREGLPIKHADWAHYLSWATQAFRLACSGVRDQTQIHTHMCYSEFNDIIDAIAAMDADVITIECARSHMELLSSFESFAYPNAIGPGVYDIHSPVLPEAEVMLDLLKQALRYLGAHQLWVNPDCGLKTRNWPEVSAALQRMTEAAKCLRQEASVLN